MPLLEQTPSDNTIMGMRPQDFGNVVVRALSAIPKTRANQFGQMQDRITQGQLMGEQQGEKQKQELKKQQLRSALKDLMQTPIESMEKEQASAALQQIHAKYDQISPDEFMNLVQTYQKGRDYWEDRSWMKEQRGQQREDWKWRGEEQGQTKEKWGREKTVFEQGQEEREGKYGEYGNARDYYKAIDGAIKRSKTVKSDDIEGLISSRDELLSFGDTARTKGIVASIEDKINQIRGAEGKAADIGLKKAQTRATESLGQQREEGKSAMTDYQKARINAEAVRILNDEVESMMLSPQWKKMKPDEQVVWKTKRLQDIKAALTPVPQAPAATGGMTAPPTSEDAYANYKSRVSNRPAPTQTADVAQPGAGAVETQPVRRPTETPPVRPTLKQTHSKPMAQTIDELEKMIPEKRMQGAYLETYPWERSRSIKESLSKNIGQKTQQGQSAELKRMGEDEITAALRQKLGITDLYKLIEIKEKLKFIYPDMADEQIAQAVADGSLLGSGKMGKGGYTGTY
ncbi:MAG: hypothetical protein V1758_11735 [Pseudomonadota bacterium]